MRLDIIWIGDDPESEIYENHKKNSAAKVGISSTIHHLPEITMQEELLDLIWKLNENPEVTGYILQLPVPEHIDSRAVFQSIEPSKDVDGLSPWNLGKLWQYQDAFIPATAAGVLRIIEEVAEVDPVGKNVVIVGTSDIVGKPIGSALLKTRATVTFCNSKTADLAFHTRNADVVISAVGKPGLITGDMIKEKAVLIDVGTKKVDGKLLGDFEFESCCQKASFITPVPGGVGPVTVVSLLNNVCEAHRKIHK